MRAPSVRDAMSYAKVLCVGLVGVTGHLVEVEADLSAGLPAVVLSGLPDTALHEARDRVRAAVVNSGAGVAQPPDHRQPAAGHAAQARLRPSIWPSPRRCWRGAGELPLARWTASWSSASWASTARSARSAACCRWSPPPPGPASRRVIVPLGNAARGRGRARR